MQEQVLHTQMLTTGTLLQSEESSNNDYYYGVANAAPFLW